MLATDSTKLLSSLHTMIAQVRDDAGALEILMDLLKKAGESTHVNEVIELLAHASVKGGNLERGARCTGCWPRTSRKTRSTCRTTSRWTIA